MKSNHCNRLSIHQLRCYIQNSEPRTISNFLLRICAVVVVHIFMYFFAHSLLCLDLVWSSLHTSWDKLYYSQPIEPSLPICEYFDSCRWSFINLGWSLGRNYSMSSIIHTNTGWYILSSIFHLTIAIILLSVRFSVRIYSALTGSL